MSLAMVLCSHPLLVQDPDIVVLLKNSTELHQ